MLLEEGEEVVADGRVVVHGDVQPLANFAMALLRPSNDGLRHEEIDSFAGKRIAVQLSPTLLCWGLMILAHVASDRGTGTWHTCDAS